MILIGLLMFPVILLQATVCTPKEQLLPSVGASVQVIVVWLVVVGQLPPFDTNML